MNTMSLNMASLFKASLIVYFFDVSNNVTQNEIAPQSFFGILVCFFRVDSRNHRRQYYGSQISIY